MRLLLQRLKTLVFQNGNIIPIYGLHVLPLSKEVIALSIAGLNEKEKNFFSFKSRY